VRAHPGDNSPPLYYLLLKVWMGLFGDTPLALRSLSVLLGGATVFGAWLFAREAFGRSSRGKEIALLAAALVALSVFQIRYAWEVRPYALGTALAALSSWALFRALHAPRRAVQPWLLYASLALLLLYTHNYALFSVAAQGLFTLGYLLVGADWDLRRLAGSPTCRGALLAGSIVAAGWLPWMPVFLRPRAQVQAAFWTPAVNADAVARICFQMLAEPEGGWRSPRLLRR
jgi:mannosyltransferase